MRSWPTMNGTKLVLTALLSLAIWMLVYIFSKPLENEEVMVIVIFSAIVVYCFDLLRSRFWKHDRGSDER